MRKYVFPIVAGLFVLILADWYIIAAANRAYEEKVRILCVIAGEQEKGTDSLVTASGLLKGSLDSYAAVGREKLESYGYLREQENWFSREREEAVRNTVLLSASAFLTYLLSLALISRSWKKRHTRELEGLSRTLEQFSRHIYELDFRERLDGRETEMERIAGQLAGLSEQLCYNEERLRQEKEETKRLVTDISHQLKTPVAGLKACLEILEQGNLSQEEEREFLEQCLRQLGGLEALVGALVNISRMETGMIEIRREPADILETLVAAVNRVYLKAEAKKIAISFEETEDLGPMVVSHDAKWLCEAFINILENAVKYSPENTEIHIRMFKRTTFLRIEFEDQGIGVPKEIYHKIFQRFYRGEAEEVSKTEGSGVGLYLTREIVERHGGSVTVSSRFGRERQGSTFVVQVPYR